MLKIEDIVRKKAGTIWQSNSAAVAPARTVTAK
jgi:hypothetical protein